MNHNNSSNHHDFIHDNVNDDNDTHIDNDNDSHNCNNKNIRILLSICTKLTERMN